MTENQTICFCRLVKENIKPGTEIINKTKDGLVRVPYYELVSAEEKKIILLQPITKKKLTISESSFQLLAKYWSQYLSGKKTRHDLRDMDTSTTYTICVMYYLYDNGIIK